MRADEYREMKSNTKTTIAAIALLASCLFAGTATANSLACVDIVGTDPFQTVPNPDTGFGEGNIPVFINGREASFFSQSTNLGFVGPASTGGPQGVLSHRWRLNGTGAKLVTFDTMRLTPNDDPDVIFDATIHFVVETGSRWDCGQIVLSGRILPGGIFDYPGIDAGAPPMRGRLCRCESDDDD